MPEMWEMRFVPVSLLPMVPRIYFEFVPSVENWNVFDELCRFD